MLYCSPYSSLFERAALGFPRTHTHTLNPQIVFIEYDTWLRGDPSEAFTFAAPASIKTAPHARLMNEMFGSYFFLLEPNRQTFYDMLGKVSASFRASRTPAHSGDRKRERVDLGDSHGRWKDPCLQTGHMTIWY
jgi:hypothetical protein